MGVLIDSGGSRQNKKGSCRYRFVRKGRLFEMKFLKEDSLQDLAGLQAVVARSLPEIDIFKPHEEDYFRDIFQFELSVLGVTANDELVAYSIIRVPGLAEDNLGRDLNLGEVELKKVAHLQAFVVHPLFRGCGLQRELAASHLQVLEDMGYEHICCTVSPKNPVSLNNILSCGFVIKKLCPKFEGWWRYILCKSISRPAVIREGTGAANATKEVRIRCSDVDGQKELLQKGYEGNRMAQISRDPEIFYRKIP